MNCYTSLLKTLLLTRTFFYYMEKAFKTVSTENKEFCLYSSSSLVIQGKPSKKVLNTQYAIHTRVGQIRRFV